MGFRGNGPDERKDQDLPVSLAGRSCRTNQYSVSTPYKECVLRSPYTCSRYSGYTPLDLEGTAVFY